MSDQNDIESGADLSLLLEEFSHRVVNQYAIAVASLNLEAAGLSDPVARAALGRAESHLRAQAEAHRALQAPIITGDVDVGDYLDRLCAALSAASLRERGVQLILREDCIALSAERCWLLGLIVAELIANSARHGFRGGRGRILVEVRLMGDQVRCQVADDGWASNDPGPSRGRRVVERLAQGLGGVVAWRFGTRGVSVILSFPLRPASFAFEGETLVGEAQRPCPQG
jgi:two-component sensor histidine kinase